MTDPARQVPALRVWVDPGCPWAWQTVRWLRDLRDRGVVRLTWQLFALEVNSSPPGTTFEDAAVKYGDALLALSLARAEGGDPGLEAYYVALGELLHDRGEEISPDLARSAADAAGMPGLLDRAIADPTLGDDVIEEYEQARELDVFGVPTLQLGDGPVMYGPIMPVAPDGDEALEWWRHVSWLLSRDDVYELKRWPRARRPSLCFVREKMDALMNDHVRRRDIWGDDPEERDASAVVEELLAEPGARRWHDHPSIIWVKAVGRFIARNGKRVAVTIAGFAVLLAGVALLVLPGPGWLLIFIGLGILSTEYVWARRLLMAANGRPSRPRTP